jgi:hypothetical protein
MTAATRNRNRRPHYDGDLAALKRHMRELEVQPGLEYRAVRHAIWLLARQRRQPHGLMPAPGARPRSTAITPRRRYALRRALEQQIAALERELTGLGRDDPLRSAINVALPLMSAELAERLAVAESNRQLNNQPTRR